MSTRRASGQAFEIGRERITNWLNTLLQPETGLTWQFLDSRVNEIKNLKDEAAGEGLDFMVYERDNPERNMKIHSFLPQKLHKYVAPYYNLPSRITKNENSEQVKVDGLNLLHEKEMYFLVVRLVTNSFWFWLERYDSYPNDQWVLAKKYKKGRPDRLTLLLSNNNIRKFKSGETFIQTLKNTINENHNRTA
jgi:hypothetical protein